MLVGFTALNISHEPYGEKTQPSGARYKIRCKIDEMILRKRLTRLVRLLKGWKNMNIKKRISAALLALSLAASSLVAYAATGTTPGYKLVNTYNESKGTITTDLYVTGGYGAVGQLGLYYDTKALDLGATVEEVLTADYDLSAMKIFNFVTGVSGSGYTVAATAETNKVVNLVNEEKGEFYFAWYSGATSNVDARSSAKKIATVKFIVADGYDAADLEKIGTKLIKFATDKPSNTNVKGYASGVYCANEENTAFRNSAGAKNKISTSVEFVGLDIEEDISEVTIKVVDASGKPVKGAYVKIGTQVVVTDANGEAVLEVPADSAYTVYYKLSEDDTYVELDEDETTAKLSAPSKISSVSVSTGVEKLTVSWSKPSSTGGSDVTKYIISYKSASGSEQTKEVSANLTSYTLTGLTGGTTYTIKVKAVNAIGEGAYSTAKTATPSKSSQGGGTGGSTGGSSGGSIGGGGSETTPVKNYTVTYEVGQNGTMTSGSKTETVKAGAKPIKVPTVKAKDGYKFLGWAKSGGSVIDPKNVVINGNTTFYAQYEKENAGGTVNAGGTATSPFVDVQAGTYYESPVQWAVNKGITTGTSATTFGPDSTCTRAQAVTFLWRAAGSPAPKNTEMVFTDVANGSYYYNAVLWAVENGITNGTSATTFSPDNNCTRAQIVTFLWRSQKTPAVDAANPFADVAASQYYTNAVLWAVGNGITNGTSATTFSPDANCTRAQIVTFLYRCLAEEK